MIQLLVCLEKKSFKVPPPLLPFGAPPLDPPPGVHLLHMKNFGFLPPKDEPHQVWLKSADSFWRRR